jgi:hypothetical protein
MRPFCFATHTFKIEMKWLKEEHRLFIFDFADEKEYRWQQLW